MEVLLEEEDVSRSGTCKPFKTGLLEFPGSLVVKNLALSLLWAQVTAVARDHSLAWELICAVKVPSYIYMKGGKPLESVYVDREGGESPDQNGIAGTLP